MYNPTPEEKIFLEQYNPNKYEKPSVTADIVIFTLSENNILSMLLIKRGGFPYKGKWAIPGGFVNIHESVDEAALRELQEETSIEDVSVEQFGTFGAVDRDPRMRVISVAYMAFIPKEALKYKAGDDAADAQLFEIKFGINGMYFENENYTFSADELAFDHEQIIKTAVMRLRNRIDYTEDAFSFLKNPNSFSIYELKKIFEAVKDTKLDTGNFRRNFFRDYVETKKVVATGQKTKNGGPDAMLYNKVK